MITFSEQIGFWSKFTFWFVLINAFVGMVFVIVVTIGGLSDVRFLLRAIREQPSDTSDDGRVEASDPELPKAFPVQSVDDVDSTPQT